MESWEKIHRSRQRELEAQIQKQREDHWHESIRNAQEHFKLDIIQWVEQGLALYTTALSEIAADVTQAGVQAIMPEETVMVSRLVRDLTRQLKEKHCLDRPGDSRASPSVPPQDSTMMTVPDRDDTDPPTPASISQWSFSGRITNPSPQKKPPNAEQQKFAPGGTGEDDEVVPEDANSPSRTITPQRNIDDSITRRKDKRPLESIETDKPSPSEKRIEKRPRLDNSHWFSETIEQEPTERGSIHCREVEGQDFIFSNDIFPGFFFVIRCDRDSSRSSRMYRFQKHPLEYNRASNHFKKEKPKEKCHEEDVKGEYDDQQLIVKFGYRVYGDDLKDKDWVARSNDKTMNIVKKGKVVAAASPSRAKLPAMPRDNGKGKAVSRAGQNKAPTRAPDSSPSTTAGPSTATRSAPRVPELGPAKRSRPSLATDADVVGQQRATVSDNIESSALSSEPPGNVNVAPLADMGIAGLSPPITRRKNPSRSASRASCRPAGVATEEMPDGLPADLPDFGAEGGWDSDSAETNRIVNEFMKSLT